MARECISRDRQRLRSDMSSTQIESEQPYRDRGVATNRAVRLPPAVNRVEDVLLRKQANYKHAEPVYKSLDAATRQVGVKFEEATAIVQPAGQQLIADRADAASFVQHAGHQFIAHLRATPRDTDDTEARLQARQHDF